MVLLHFQFRRKLRIRCFQALSSVAVLPRREMNVEILLGSKRNFTEEAFERSPIFMNQTNMAFELFLFIERLITLMANVWPGRTGGFLRR